MAVDPAPERSGHGNGHKKKPREVRFAGSFLSGEEKRGTCGSRDSVFILSAKQAGDHRGGQEEAEKHDAP